MEKLHKCGTLGRRTVSMKCESCHSRDASVHLTQVVNGVVKKLNLCEQCAAQSGLDLSAPMALTDLLKGMEQAQKAMVPPVVRMANPSDGNTCPQCGSSLQHIQKRGRLGCDQCYEVFAVDIAPLLSTMQRGSVHHGKVPAHLPTSVRVTAEAGRLQLELDKAIAAENFEEAARLRDRIQVCLEIVNSNYMDVGLDDD